jgi:uncharacterized protein (TIGR03545 family)
MLRWKYVLPRAIVLSGLFVAFRFGLDPLLKYALVAGGEAALGAKVEVAELSTSLLDGQLVIEGLVAANPRKPMRNLAEAERVQLNVDFAALMHKRLVVKSGLVRGVRFDAERTTTGALEPTVGEADAGPSMLDPLVTDASDSAMEWMGSLQGRIEDDLESKLATPRVLRELEDRWQQQYAALTARADALRAKAKKIEADFREAKKNPLRSLPVLQSLQQELTATQTELTATLAELKGLPAQAQADRKAIDAARKQDQEFLKNAVHVVRTDGAQLTEYLLGETVHGYVSQTMGWVNSIRSWIPKSKMERPARSRGTNVLFVDRRDPKCLIERVTLTGEASVGGETLEVIGELCDATTEPQFHAKPMTFTLRTTGSIEGTLLATIDRRTADARDTLVIDYPHVALRERNLGAADKLAVNVAAGEASIAGELHLRGDVLSGVITLRQASTLAARTPALRDDRIATMLTESLAGVDRLEAEVTVSGTLRKPKWKIESNLGPQLAEGINGAVRRYLTERRDRLVAKVQGKVDEQLAKLDAKRQEAQQELMGKLGENQELVGQLASLMGGGGAAGGLPGGLSIPQIGSALKLDRVQR